MIVFRYKLSATLFIPVLMVMLLFLSAPHSPVQAQPALQLEGFINTLNDQGFGGRGGYFGDTVSFTGSVQADREDLTEGTLMFGINVFDELMPDTGVYLQGGYGYRTYTSPPTELLGPQLGASFFRDLSGVLTARTFLRLGIYPDEYDLYYRTGFSIEMTQNAHMNIDITGFTLDEPGFEVGIQLNPGGIL